MLAALDHNFHPFRIVMEAKYHNLYSRRAGGVANTLTSSGLLCIFAGMFPSSTFKMKNFIKMQ